ncbi:MAG: type II toxin-antitoxin system RelB/DinJ family antitoxin [Bifidobacteriaceae bacterium]|jgi:DNA-damage-inducible protein J|nr:type II toxin-antitoxin system RelB/DinJ family antitoxin [Bifidobacteriaceae bacterium]
MPATASVNFRIDSALKRSMEETCHDLGITMTTAFTIFAKKMARERRIPFEVSVDPFFAEENQAHLREVRADVEAGRNMSVHDLIED